MAKENDRFKRGVQILESSPGGSFPGLIIVLYEKIPGLLIVLFEKFPGLLIVLFEKFHGRLES